MLEESRKNFLQISGIMAFLFFIGVLIWIYSLTAFKLAPWGIFITNFLFLLGLAQGALAITVALRIGSARWSAPFYRLAAVIALAFFPVALLMLLTIIFNQGAIFYWAGKSTHPWFNSSFFSLRHLLSFFLFYGLALVLFNTSMTENPLEEKTFNYRLLILGLFLLLAFVIRETIMAWDFGMTINPNWGSTVFAPFFLAGSLRAGMASLVLLMTFLKRFFKVEFPVQIFENLGQLHLAFAVFWFYLWWAQFLPMWFGNLPEDTEVLFLRIFSQYGPVYGLSMVLAAVIPFFALLFKRVRSSMEALSGVSILILIGLWLERFLLVVPALVEEHKIVYTPILSFTNLFFTLGTLGGFFLFFFFLLSRYPRALPTKEARLEEDLLILEPRGW